METLHLETEEFLPFSLFLEVLSDDFHWPVTREMRAMRVHNMERMLE